MLNKKQAVFWLSILLKRESKEEFVEALKMGIKALLESKRQ